MGVGRTMEQRVKQCVRDGITEMVVGISQQSSIVEFEQICNLLWGYLGRE